MESQQKPQSRFFWVFLLCVLLLIGGALLGLFVLPDLFSVQTGAASTPTQTQSAPASATPADTATPPVDATPTEAPTPVPTPVDPADSMSETVSMARQSVVSVMATYGQGETLHSGFVYGDGFIVTTYAGFENAASYAVLFDGEDTPVGATVVQYDAMNNLLVLTTARTDLVPVTISDATSKAGDYVFAVGTPLSIRFHNLVTRGIVCGTGYMPDDDQTSYILTDAATNPGETGGVLFNNRGEMIGMLTDIRADAGYDEKGDPIAALGMTFAVPVSSLQAALDTLVTGQSIQRASLDMSYIDLTSRQLTALSLLSGVRVTAVQTGGSAQLAGIKNGDVITAFNGVTITNSAMLDALIDSSRVGDIAELTRYKNGLNETISVTVTNAE